jgi:ankyrin repeat protein
MTDPRDAFLIAACVPRDALHSSGTLDEANELLNRHPGLAADSIHTAAAAGDDSTVRRFLGADPTQANNRGGPYGWDALTHLCFSRYLRLDRGRTPAFVRAARALLDSGANPNTGWFEQDHQPSPEWESVIYGAAGVAHNADMTRLLLDYGADPNDGETPYHVPETYENDAMKVLVESGKLNERSMGTLLLRKADWHDADGIRYLLERGANPNYLSQWKYTPLHQALRRDNDIAIISALLDHGADPFLASAADGRTAVSVAARRGRRDVLELLERRGTLLSFQGVERLISAAARDDSARIAAITKENPELVTAMLREGATVLSEFAGVGNTAGVRHLLDLGVPVDAIYAGDGYWDVAPGSTALHVAAWRARHDTVRLLVQRGAQVNRQDGKGRTPLVLAVKACIDSYWMRMRSPDSARALLDAGAFPDGVHLPTGYDEIDRILLPGQSRT